MKRHVSLVPTPETYNTFAVVAPGLERIARDELRALGVRAIGLEAGGLEFRSSRELLYRLNLHASVPTRFLVRIAEFGATTFAELESRARRIAWGKWLRDGTTVALRVSCRKSRLYHSDAVAERFAGVLARRVEVRSGGGETDDPETDDSGGVSVGLEQPILIRLDHDRCVVSLDSSGEPLHRRGYRLASGKAPVRENLAAACIMATLSEQHNAFCDPFCGSGTIPIELARRLRRIPPGIDRNFACASWPDFDQATFDTLRDRALAAIVPSTGVRIVGSDRDAGAIQAARENSTRARVSDDIEFEQHSISDAEPTGATGLLLTNPPYGVRVGDDRVLRDLYARFGMVLRTRFRGWRIAILSPNRRLESHLRIPLSEWLSFSNGGIAVKLLGAELTMDASKTPERGATDRPER